MPRIRWVVIAVASLMIAGCSADGASSGSSGYTPTTSASPTPTSSPTSSASSDRPIVTTDEIVGAEQDPVSKPKSQGADAAPGSPNPMYDASAEAEQNFIAWFAYETYDESDFPSKDRAAVYADGVALCTQLRTGKDPSLAMYDIEHIKSYSGTGAAALYKAAINALCPWHNQGFQTHIDQSVNRMMSSVNRSISWTPNAPPFYDYGNFAKEVCGYLSIYRTDGLEEHLRGLQGTYTQGNMMVYISGDTTYMKILVKESVMSLCDAHLTTLGPYWMNI